MHIFGVPLSALSIMVALVGICLNLLVTTPHTRHLTIDGGTFQDEKNFGRKERRERWQACVGNVMLVAGTVGQFLSILLGKK